MRISFVIPSKDGGEGLMQLFQSIRENVAYAISRGLQFDYEILLVINGDSPGIDTFISRIDKKDDTKIFYIAQPGKVLAINHVLPHIKSDYIAVLDDDIYFGNQLLFVAIQEATKGGTIIAFQTRALPYAGKSLWGKFCYNIINIRSLKKLYTGIDPFLIGRFIFIKKDLYVVPDTIINEDLYLSIIYTNRYTIRPEEVYYYGESSLRKHVARVIRIESGRKQVRRMFGVYYDTLQKSNARIVSAQKVRSLNLYDKFCYYCYKVLRFITNKIITKLLVHKTHYW